MGLRLLALENLCKNFIKLHEDKMLNKVLAVSSLQQDILELNFQDQLYDKGITSDNKPIGDYTPYSKQLKISGDGDHRIDHITLKDKGYFYDSGKIKLDQHDFFITADTMKPDVDLMTYGRILGLTDYNKGVVAQWIKAPFIKELRLAIWK